MNYNEAIAYLSEIEMLGSVLGLEAITELLKRLGNPQDQLRFVHVGGTNGKGSTSSFTANALAFAGYRVGRYLSPVLLDYCEKIQVIKRSETAFERTQFEELSIMQQTAQFEEQWITQSAVAEYITAIRKVCEGMVAEGLPQPTIFEVETAMAFLEYVRQGCDIVVLEVGLGGRLDATNVISTVECSVITSISMDHMQYLGETIEQIATEKAGIIKPNSMVVTYEQLPSVEQVLKTAASRTGAKFISADFTKLKLISESLDGSVFEYKGSVYQIGLLGAHQVKNAAVAIECVQALKSLGYQIPLEAIQLALKQTTWFGRMTVVSKEPTIILDGAHNEDAARTLSESLGRYFGNRKATLVMGVFADKQYQMILKHMLPLANRVFVFAPKNSRALQANLLKEEVEVQAKSLNLTLSQLEAASSAVEALDKAKEMVLENEYIVCFGSLSFLHELI